MFQVCDGFEYRAGYQKDLRRGDARWGIRASTMRPCGARMVRKRDRLLGTRWSRSCRTIDNDDDDDCVLCAFVGCCMT